MKKKLSKKNKKTLLIFLVILLVPISILIIIPFSPLDTSTLYITGNDVITNYNLESFDGSDIVDGTVPELENKLKLEPSAFWKMTEDDLEVINTYVDGNFTSVEYFATLRSKINIYTNVRLHQAVEKNFNTIPEEFPAGSYRHLALDGNTRSHWESYLHWTHYDFGDVETYNMENNLFQGALKLSFDINPNPIPLNFVDDDGNQIEKQFDYICINAMWVSDSIHGKLSTDLPDFVELTPAHYESTEENDWMGAGIEGSMVTQEGDDYSHVWDPDPKLSDPVGIPRDSGIQGASIGSTLTPKNKDGSNIWDPYNNQKSMEDCSFTYNLGALSPLVYEYTSQLSYKRDNIRIQDYWKSLFVLGSYVVDGTAQQVSHTRQVGLHVTNRYFQVEFAAKFKLFTGFEIKLADTEEPELELPKEYYDELLFQLLVDGFGGGRTYTEGIEFGGLSDLISIIIVIVIAIAGIYIFVTVVIPLFVKKEVVGVIRKH